MREYQEQLHANKLDNTNKMCAFLDIDSKKEKKKKENLNSPIAIKILIKNQETSHKELQLR